MGKTKKDVQPEQTAPDEQNIEAATAQAETRPDETAKEGEPQSGADPERPEDSEMDQGGETQPVDPEWIAGLNGIADKVFAGQPVQTLYFTADRLGFGSMSDAEAHASTLDDTTITEITRK